MTAALIWPGLALLYLLLPGHPLALLAGLPMSDFALGLGLVIGLSAWCGGLPRGRIMPWAGLALSLAAAAKVLLAAAALPYGLTAAYTIGADPNQTPERSTEWRIDGATRVDRELDFVGDRFPVHFFNDLHRFNFYTPSHPRRDLLPFAVTWRGWLEEPADRQHCLRLAANGMAHLRVGDGLSAGIEGASHVETRDVCALVKRGANPLTVDYARPQGGVPYLSVSEIEASGQTRPLDSERLLRTPAAYDVVQRDRWAGRIAWALDALVIGSWACVIVVGMIGPWRRSVGLERPLVSLAILAAFAEALALHRHFSGRAAILSGGNDWLAYESNARDVLLSGLLMTGGKPLGLGEPFYYQPLYGYFLAGVHLLLGESIYGLLVVQHVLVAAAGVLNYVLARELFGRPAAAAAFALFWLGRYLIFNQVAGLLLSENLVEVIIPPMLLMLARWQRTWRRADLAGGGVLLGLAALTRSTPLLFLPPVLLAVGTAQLRKFGQLRAAVGAAGLLLVVTLGVFGLAGLRNLMVAGRPVLLPESASTNIYEVHRPSAKVDLSRIERDPLYNRLGLDRRTREVLEFVRQDPVGYAATLVPMGLYAVGFTGPALGTKQIQYELVLLACLYLAGLLLVPAVRAAPVWLLHAFVLTHFVQMMVFMSHQYGFRLPLPMYGPMTVIAGRTLLAAAGLIGRSWPELGARRGGLLAAGGTVTVLLVGFWTGLELVRPRDAEAQVFGLGGDAGPSARALSSSPESWLADRLFFSGRDGRSFGIAYLPGLTYREMKWVDSSQALVWPAAGKQGLLVRPAGPPSSLMAECWAGPAREAHLETPAGTDRVLQWLPDPAQRQCATDERRQVSFGGLIDVLNVWRASAIAPDSADLRAAWRVVQHPAFRVQLVAEQIEPDGAVRGVRLADPYPSGSWEAGELVVARIPAPVQAEAPPARLALGFTRGSPSSRLTIDDPLAVYGQTRVIAGE